jgi:TRAP-type C4-dicarboxylate transport system permease small subunit
MPLLLGLLRPIELWNDVVLRIGRWIGIVAIGLMVVAILIQVFFRYVLNNALPWPDEAARFCMLWMTGLMAPTAFRRGGFVAIDMVVAALPQRIGAILTLGLLLISAAVLAVGIKLGWGEVNSFMSNSKMAALYYFDFSSGEFEKMPRRWMFYSLFVGVILLFIVNIELILRSVIEMLGGADRLRPIAPGEEEIMAE